MPDQRPAFIIRRGELIFQDSRGSGETLHVPPTGEVPWRVLYDAIDLVDCAVEALGAEAVRRVLEEARWHAHLRETGIVEGALTMRDEIAVRVSRLT